MGKETQLRCRREEDMRRLRTEKRRRSINSVVEKRILTAISTWPPNQPLSWEALLDVLERDLGHRWTRQGLAKRIEIKEAFQAKSRKVRSELAQKRPIAARPPETVVRDQYAERLKNELQEAKATIERYHELFITYQYNAMILGLSVERLEAPMPQIDRGQTDTDILHPRLPKGDRRGR